MISIENHESFTTKCDNIASEVSLEQKNATDYRFSQGVLRIYSPSALCLAVDIEGGLPSRNTRITSFVNFTQGNWSHITCIDA